MTAKCAYTHLASVLTGLITLALLTGCGSSATVANSTVSKATEAAPTVSKATAQAASPTPQRESRCSVRSADGSGVSILTSKPAMTCAQAEAVVFHQTFHAGPSYDTSYSTAPGGWRCDSTHGGVTPCRNGPRTITETYQAQATACQDGQCKTVDCPPRNAADDWICESSQNASVRASVQTTTAPAPFPVSVSCQSDGAGGGVYDPSASAGQGGCLYRYAGGFQIVSPPGTYLRAVVDLGGAADCTGYEWSNGQSSETC